MKTIYKFIRSISENDKKTAKKLLEEILKKKVVEKVNSCEGEE